jgi:hypothetical protein
MRLLVLLCLGCLLGAATLENRNVEGPEMAPILVEHVPFAATITVRNPNDRAVRVERLDASCTCMRLELAERFLLPHQASTLTLQIDNANRSGPQRMGVTIYFTDPEMEPIEVTAWWHVTPDVAVDAISPLADPAQRPADIAWRDVYKYVEHERPDELHRLSKRVRVSSAVPGFEILGIDYPGAVWTFTPTRLAEGVWLVTAKAQDPAGTLPPKTYDEHMVIRTNHPKKAKITLQFVAVISTEAGRAAIDPMAIPGPPPGL